MEELRQGLITCIIQRPGLLSRRAALLCQTSQKTKLVESPGRCSREARLWTTVVVELPSGHSKGGGFSSAALGGSAARSKGADPSSAALGHRPQNRAKGADPRTGNLKGDPKCFCPLVSCLLPVLACLCFAGLSWFRVAGSPAHASGFFGFLFVFVPPGVSFCWPRASRSSSQREGRRVKLRGTDPRTGTGPRPKDRLLQVSLYLRRCVLLSSSRLPCSSPFLFATLCVSEGVPPLRVFIELVAVLREFFPFFGQLPGDFHCVRLFLPLSQRIHVRDPASYLPEGGYGHYLESFYGDMIPVQSTFSLKGFRCSSCYVSGRAMDVSHTCPST